jgi:hypothetical protein
MDEMRAAIIRWNIERYERQLVTEADAATRRTLQALLVEAQNEALLLSAETTLERQRAQRGELMQEARRWRLRAEEYRVIAEACQSDAARSAYSNLARGYERLAQRAETFAANEAGAGPKPG